MLKRSIWLVFAVLVLVVSAAGIVSAVGGSGSPWQSSSDPTFSKITDLAPSVLPSSSNFDCNDITVRAYSSSTLQPDCVTTTPFGQVGSYGVIFNGTPNTIPIVPGFPFSSLQPIPNSGTLMTYTSAPVVGNYLHFYTSIRDKMSGAPQNVNGRWQYTLTANPDKSLRDSSNKPVPANINAMAFSPNGSWMVVDLPWVGFVRIKLSTLEIKPFASSMQQNGDYSDRRAQLAISNDGLTVAVKPSGFDQLKVYDLSNCSDASLPVAPGTDRCAMRDYYPFIGSRTSNLRTIYQPRFINSSQLMLTVMYDYAPGNFKVAKYFLTAPGEPPSGLPYLGMGDSFASGEGAYDYIAGTDTSNDTCHLSSKNYAYAMVAHIFPQGKAVSCSGAVTDDITNLSDDYKGQAKDKIQKIDRDTTFIQSVKSTFLPGYLAQSEFVDQYRPEAITLSIGGNDIGFSDILKRCVSPVSTDESCYPTYEDRLELATSVNGIFDRLVDTYKTVMKPGKRLYVIGYPHVTYPGGNCASNVHLDDHELQMAADLVDYLNVVISRAADKAGARYVDISHSLDGHRLCETVSTDIAVNGFTAGRGGGIGPLKFIGTESYHPNARGHTMMESTIRAQTSNLTQAMPVANPASQPPAIPTSIVDAGLPRSGRTTNIVVASNDVAPDLLTRTENVPVFVDAAKVALKAFTLYKIVMHSAEVQLGTATSDGLGNLSTNVQIPAGTPPGIHTLHIYGPNLLGQSIDITKTVYVADAANANQCGFIPLVGLDKDQDGLDDACDGDLSMLQSPTPTSPTRRTNSVTLTGNSITITR